MTESSNAYRTVAVGTDGPGSSLRAVPRAGAPAGAYRIVGACGHLPTGAGDREVVRAQDALRVRNRGFDGVGVRLPGPVPAGAARRSRCDVLVVHTTD